MWQLTQFHITAICVYGIPVRTCKWMLHAIFHANLLWQVQMVYRSLADHFLPRAFFFSLLFVLNNFRSFTPIFATIKKREKKTIFLASSTHLLHQVHLFTSTESQSKLCECRFKTKTKKNSYYGRRRHSSSSSYCCNTHFNAFVRWNTGSSYSLHLWELIWNFRE